MDRSGGEVAMLTDEEQVPVVRAAVTPESVSLMSNDDIIIQKKGSQENVETNCTTANYFALVYDYQMQKEYGEAKFQKNKKKMTQVVKKVYEKLKGTYRYFYMNGKMLSDKEIQRKIAYDLVGPIVIQKGMPNCDMNWCTTKYVDLKRDESEKISTKKDVPVVVENVLRKLKGLYRGTYELLDKKRTMLSPVEFRKRIKRSINDKLDKKKSRSTEQPNQDHSDAMSTLLGLNSEDDISVLCASLFNSLDTPTGLMSESEDSLGVGTGTSMVTDSSRYGTETRDTSILPVQTSPQAQPIHQSNCGTSIGTMNIVSGKSCTNQAIIQVKFPGLSGSRKVVFSSCGLHATFEAIRQQKNLPGLQLDSYCSRFIINKNKEFDTETWVKISQTDVNGTNLTGTGSFNSRDIFWCAGNAYLQAVDSLNCNHDCKRFDKNPVTPVFCNTKKGPDYEEKQKEFSLNNTLQVLFYDGIATATVALNVSYYGSKKTDVEGDSSIETLFQAINECVPGDTPQTITLVDCLSRTTTYSNEKQASSIETIIRIKHDNVEYTGYSEASNIVTSIAEAYLSTINIVIDVIKEKKKSSSGKPIRRLRS